jgi:hypothetical protein
MIENPSNTKAMLVSLGLTAIAGLTILQSGPASAAPPKPQSAQMQSTATREPVCSSYGQAGEKWRNRATAQGCKVAAIPVPKGWASYTWGANQLFSYCMGSSDAAFRGRSAQALGHKAQLEKACSQQLRRPVKL